MRNATLEKLVWVLIYGGILSMCLGIFMQPRDAAAGWTLIALGAVATLAGAIAIYVRSRRSD